MAFPVIREGFCGCTLKTSSLFIAWFSLFISFTGLIAMGYVGIEAADEFAHQPEGTAITARQFAELITYIAIVIYALIIIFNVLLVVGIYKERHCLIFPYICIKTTVLLLALFGSVQMLIKGQFSQQNWSVIVFGFLEAYFVFILYSYYRELKDKYSLNTVYNQQILSDNSFKKGGVA